VALFKKSKRSGISSRRSIAGQTSRIVGFTLLLVILNLVWLIPVIRNARLSASALALEIADRVRANIGLYVENSLDDLSLAAEEVAAEPERQDLVLRRLLRKNSGLKSVSVVDLSGMETTRVDRLILVMTTDLRDVSRDVLFNEAREGVASVGQVFVSSSYEPRLSIAIPVYSAGMQTGVLMAELNLRNLVNVLRVPEIVNGHVYVVDNRGYQVLHPNLSELLRRPNFLSRSIVERVVEDRLIVDGLSRDDGYVNESGEDVFTVGIPVPVADLGIIVEQPRRDALAVEYQMRYIAALATLIGVFMFWVILLANTSLRRALQRQEELLAENYSSAKLLVRKDRELVQVNRELTSLAAELEEVGKILVRRDLRLSEANERLQEVDHIKSEFVSIAAHQLRTPLTGIRWTLHSLIDGDLGPLSSEQQEAASKALDIAIAAVELIGDLLDVARIDVGKLGYQIVLEPIGPIIEKAVAEASLEASRKEIKLSVTIASDLPPLLIDKQKIGIVCANFLSNAIKYTPSGGSVDVKAEAKEDKVQISVSDTGIGIPKDQAHRVFTQFFRATNAQRMSPTGSGLGLFVVKSIVEHHDGTISFTSEEGKGTTILFALPVPRK
jgi:signal transduction histidine kinase